MIESYLKPGRQTWHPDVIPDPEQSITDACIDWEETDMLLDFLHRA